MQTKSKRKPSASLEWQHIYFLEDDWQDETAYKKYENLKNSEYAWEFLRRSPEYNSAYYAYLADAKKHRHPSTSPAHVALRVKHGKPWQLEELYKPSISSVRFRQLKQVPALKGYKLKIWEGEPDVQRLSRVEDFKRLTKPRSSHIVIAFDARKHIDQMLEEARILLEKRQYYIKAKKLEKLPMHNPPRQNFPLYLRIIDAVASGANQAKMIRILHKQNEEKLIPADYNKISSQIKAALQQMQDYSRLQRSKR